MSFVHLHTHSEFSCLDGMASIVELVEAAHADGNPALAITDHGSMAGLWKLYTECRKRGMIPIPGVEAYLAIGSRKASNTKQVPHDLESPEQQALRSEPRLDTKSYEHITILARNATGWANLVRLHNDANQYQVRNHPRIDYDSLSTYGDGLMVLTGCIGGPVAGELAAGRPESARANLASMIGAVGRDNVYVEVADHGIEAQVRVMDALYALAAEFGIECVAANDAHFVQPSDQEAHNAWFYTRTNMSFHGAGHHLRTEAEMRALRPHDARWQRACDMTAIVAARVESDWFPEPYTRLPHVALPEGFASTSDYLIHLTQEGLQARYPEGVTADHIDRANRELGVIMTQGFADYFVIVHEVVDWARSQGIYVGPGRGSAAGSLVSYALGIVNVDPLQHGLLFERFMDTTRAEMPDIDLDFEKGRRGEIVAHLVERYGETRVVRLGTYQMARTKAAIKDSARFYSMTPVGNALTAKLATGVTFQHIDLGIPEASAFLAVQNTIEDVYQRCERDVQTAKEQGKDVRFSTVEHMLGIARAFENTVRGLSVHACGVIISDVDLTALIPLKYTPKSGEWSTEWDGADCAATGLLKLDVLGLRNLDIMHRTVDLVQRERGETLPIHDLDALLALHPGQQVMWDMIGRGETSSVFQLESGGMQDLCRMAGPHTPEDIAPLIALYRPGPMGQHMHTTWAMRVSGREDASYHHITHDLAEQDVLRGVLDQTRGTIAYQEQLMQLSQLVANFQPHEADKLRKAVSKKKQDQLDELKPLFIAGAQVAGMTASGIPTIAFSATTAEVLWVTFEASGRYLFNKSHAVAYGNTSLSTAFLKAYYPSEYFAACLSVVPQNADNLVRRLSIMRTAREWGIAMLAPSLNSSDVLCASRGGSVHLGFSDVKSLSTIAAHAIVAERERGGPYMSLHDARRRLADRGVGRSDWRALCASGALDAFGPRLGVATVLEASSPRDVTVPDMHYGTLETSIRQRESIGTYFGEHPMTALHAALGERVFPLVSGDGHRTTSPGAVTPDTLPQGDRLTVFVIGVVASYKEFPYSKGTRGLLALEGASGDIVWGTLWNEECLRLTSKPVVGSIVQVRAVTRHRVEERVVGAEGDDVDLDALDAGSVELDTHVETVTSLELTVKDIYAVDVPELSAPHGTLVGADHDVLAARITALGVPRVHEAPAEHAARTWFTDPYLGHVSVRSSNNMLAGTKTLGMTAQSVRMVRSIVERRDLAPGVYLVSGHLEDGQRWIASMNVTGRAPKADELREMVARALPVAVNSATPQVIDMETLTRVVSAPHIPTLEAIS